MPRRQRLMVVVEFLWMMIVSSRAFSRRVMVLSRSSPSHAASLSQRRRHCFFSTKSVPTAETIAEVYEAHETDGILGLELPSSNDAAELLWQNTVQAAQHRPGPAASMLNAWLANCYQHHQHADLARELYHLATTDDDESKDSKLTIRPDVVTHCILYSLLGDETHLQQAAKLSDYPGARKKRAAARRKPRISTFAEAQDTLQSLLGSDFGVLYECDDYAVVNKPAGVACFHQQVTAAGKVRKPNKGNKTKKKHCSADTSLEDAVLNTVRFHSNINRGLVHRLDRGTSGCLVLPKSPAAHARLVTDFFLRRIHKSYTCLVHCDCDQQLAKDGGVLEMPVDGRPARSTFQVLERFDDRAALLKVETTTGRKHQVRVHCAQGLGCPIVGDDLYGSANDDDLSSQRLLFLHAATMEMDGRTISAPLPSFWEERLAHLSQ